MDEKWPILGSEIALQHPFVTVDLETVLLPDGRIIPDWPRVHARDYVNPVVLNDREEALVITGYKHGLGRSSWQVLGGYLEPGEAPMPAAQRELLEETGYYSDEWEHLGSFVVDANRYVGTGHFYLARAARQVALPDNDDLEQYAIHWVSLPELRRALHDGRIAILSYAVNVALGLLRLGV